MNEKGISHKDFIGDWLEVPYTNPQITELRNKLTFWSFITLILALSNVKITTLFFIRFVDPIEKVQILPFVWGITIYYLSFWLTRLTEHLRERKASNIVAQFMALEEKLVLLQAHTGNGGNNDDEWTGAVLDQYKNGKERLNRVKMGRLLAFLAYDVVVPAGVVIGALTLTIQSFCIPQS